MYNAALDQVSSSIASNEFGNLGGERLALLHLSILVGLAQFQKSNVAERCNTVRTAIEGLKKSLNNPQILDVSFFWNTVQFQAGALTVRIRTHDLEGEVEHAIQSYREVDQFWGVFTNRAWRASKSTFSFIHAPSAPLVAVTPPKTPLRTVGWVPDAGGADLSKLLKLDLADRFAVIFVEMIKPGCTFRLKETETADGRRMELLRIAYGPDEAFTDEEIEAGETTPTSSEREEEVSELVFDLSVVEGEVNPGKLTVITKPPSDPPAIFDAASNASAGKKGRAALKTIIKTLQPLVNDISDLGIVPESFSFHIQNFPVLITVTGLRAKE